MNSNILKSIFPSYENNRKIFFILFSFAIYYSYIASTGYGNDDDTYRMMSTGINLLSNHVYIPSRFQGYLIPEISIGFLSSIGGFYLSNAASVLMSIVVLVLYYNILRHFLSVNKSLIALVIIGINPYFVIISSTSMDYIYNLFFIFLGVFFLTRKSYILAAIFLAFALSSRLSSSLLVFIIFVYFILNEAKESKITLSSLMAQKATYSAILSLLITILLYLPVFISSDYSLSFLAHYNPDFSLAGYLGRIFYYNMAVLGGFLVLLTLLFTAPYKALYRYIRHGNPTLLFYIAVVSIILVEMVFIHLPYEREFLIPMVILFIPFFLYFSKSLIPAYVVLSLTTLSNVINIDIIDIKYSTLPNGDTKADTATVGLSVKPGFVVRDVEMRGDSARRYLDEFLYMGNSKSSIERVKYLTRTGIRY